MDHGQFFSPFPQMRNSERPDRVAIAIEQGKVAVLTEGTPFALIMPTTVTDMVSSPEDQYQDWLFASLLRALRWCCVFISPSCQPCKKCGEAPKSL